jgi:hypothetical protein
VLPKTVGEPTTGNGKLCKTLPEFVMLVSASSAIVGRETNGTGIVNLAACASIILSTSPVTAAIK